MLSYPNTDLWAYLADTTSRLISGTGKFNLSAYIHLQALGYVKNTSGIYEDSRFRITHSSDTNLKIFIKRSTNEGEVINVLVFTYTQGIASILHWGVWINELNATIIPVN